MSSERSKGNFHTILMARLSRITVTLSLIVAITIQPTMVCALNKACADSCASRTSCQGCGGCQVDAPGERCGCCSGHAEQVSDDESASCCGHSSHEQQRISFATDDELLAEAEIVEGAVANDNSSCCTAESLGSASSSRAVESRCHCLHSPGTPCLPESRSTASEVRELVSLGFELSVVAEPKEQLPSDRALGDGLSSAILHFAQIELCVWRL